MYQGEIVLYLVFWLGVGFILYWFYKHNKEDKNSYLLAWGLSMVFIVSALWCASIWFNYSNSYFGGWNNQRGWMMGDMQEMHNWLENNEQ